MQALRQLEQLYDEHGQALFAFLLNLTRNEADTRDLLQDLFVKLARDPGVLEGVQNNRAFLMRLAYNAAIDQKRRAATRQKHDEALAQEFCSVFEASQNPDEEVLREALSGALSEIPEEQRAVLHLKLWEGMTFEAIAELIEISTNTAASRYRYGLDKLRQRLRPLYDEIK